MENKRPNELKTVEIGYSQGPFPLCLFLSSRRPDLELDMWSLLGSGVWERKDFGLGAASYRLTRGGVSGRKWPEKGTEDLGQSGLEGAQARGV